MALIRVYKLAKEAGIPNSEVMAKLKEAGLKVNSLSSKVDENLVRRVLGLVTTEQSATVQTARPTTVLRSRNEPPEKKM